MFLQVPRGTKDILPQEISSWQEIESKSRHLFGLYHYIEIRTPIFENISLFKRGAYLINTARGAVVETKALITALEDGTIAGAGLDVLEEEGEEQINSAEVQYLIKHPRVILTPHVAFDTGEAIRRILDTTVENIKSLQ